MNAPREEDEVPEVGIDNVTSHGCGCSIVTYTDGSVQADLCIPCALSNAGDMLKHVARKMAVQREMDQLDGGDMLGGSL